jgi:mRNA-degrading endonuclease toxin of MazEF toxin-antitoxin module
MKRGDIFIALAPTVDGSASKSRPFLIVQSEHD